MIEAYLRANKMFVDYNEVFQLSNFVSEFHISHCHYLIFLLFSLPFFNQPQIERVYSSYLELDLGDVEPCVSGPKR